MQVMDGKVLLGRVRAAGTLWMWVAAAVPLLVGFWLYATGTLYWGYFSWLLAKLLSPFLALLILDLLLAAGATRSARRATVVGCLAAMTLLTIGGAFAAVWWTGYLIGAVLLVLPLLPAWWSASRPTE